MATQQSVIEKRTFVRASRSRVWRALTDPKEFGAWFGVEIAGPFAPGSRVEMKTTSKEFSGIRFFIVIERMEPETTFAWRWHPGMPQPEIDYSKEPTTLVTFHLEETEGGTNLTVVETGFDQISLARRASVYSDNEKGWDDQLASISRYVASHER
jgi:uncharacterized protein YndB with AHSA1/START domain